MLYQAYQFQDDLMAPLRNAARTLEGGPGSGPSSRP